MSASGYLYWTDQGTDKVQRSDLTGGGIVDLQTGLNTPKGIALHLPSGHIYWTDPTVSYIRRCDTDGSNMVPIISGASNYFQGLAIDEDNGHIYVGGNPGAGEESRIARCDLDGSNYTQLISGDVPLGTPIDVALDIADNKFYWTSSSNNYIGWSTLNGGSSGVLISGQDTPMELEIDLTNNKLYWTVTGADDEIRRADLDGSNVETVVPGLNRPHGLALDVPDSNMYFTEVVLGTVSRCTLDGSNITTIVSGLTNPQWIALESSLISSGSIQESGNLFIYGHDEKVISGDLFVAGRNNFAISGNLFISGSITPTPGPSDSPLRIIHRLVRAGDYNPQLIGSFENTASSVNIRVWDIVDGVNTQEIISSSGCYEIGNTNTWGWSTEYLPFASGYHNYHYYYEMTSNIGETEYGEFFLTVPERGRWVCP